jgi:hypothetical protein
MTISAQVAEETSRSVADSKDGFDLSTSPCHLVTLSPCQRSPAQRSLYLQSALSSIPRLLGAIDRNPYRPTYGCLDREYWHYRTSCFPSEMYQEGVLPLALVCTQRLPGNRWHGNDRVRELAIAALRFAARSCHHDGSCDDYYPFERALGAAAFSFAAATEAYRLLRLEDAELMTWLRLRANWLMRHDESGHLANHQALVALGLARLWKLTGEATYLVAARQRVRTVLDWQSSEGWFEEYGGADPGYHTVTIDCLAKYRRLTGEGELDKPLKRAVAFARMFLHPDDSFGGQYGSRGTYHFYPHGMELLAGENADAADLADGFLRALAAGKHAYFDDDRLYAHRLGNLIEAYLDWSPQRPPGERLVQETRYLPQAGLLVNRTPATHTVISAARGGVFKHFDLGNGRPAVTDAGLIVQLTDGRVAVSQSHDLSRHIEFLPANNSTTRLVVSGPLHFVRFETATPLKQAVLHLGMSTLGRFCRTAVRRLLQRRLITGRRVAPIRLTRKFELMSRGTAGRELRVIDTIELSDRRVMVARMSIGTDHETAYVAASGVYQESVLQPWTDWRNYVNDLNAARRVVIVREY